MAIIRISSTLCSISVELYQKQKQNNWKCKPDCQHAWLGQSRASGMAFVDVVEASVWESVDLAYIDCVACFPCGKSAAVFRPTWTTPLWWSCIVECSTDYAIDQLQWLFLQRRTYLLHVIAMRIHPDDGTKCVKYTRFFVAPAKQHLSYRDETIFLEIKLVEADNFDLKRLTNLER